MKIPRITLFFGTAIAFILVIPAVIFIICVLFDIPMRAPAFEKRCFALDFKNAPEGTARVELLDGNDLLKDVYEEWQTEPCEEYSAMVFFAVTTPEEYQELHGRFRAAYVGEDGNILGVTAPARYSYGSSKARVMTADGDRLTFCTGAPADWQMTVLYVAIAAEFLAGLVFLVFASVSIAGAAVEKLARRRRI